MDEKKMLTKAFLKIVWQIIALRVDDPKSLDGIKQKPKKLAHDSREK